LKVEEVRKGFLGVLKFLLPRAPGEFFGDREMVERKDHVAKIKKDNFNGRMVHQGCVAFLFYLHHLDNGSKIPITKSQTPNKLQSSNDQMAQTSLVPPSFHWEEGKKEGKFGDWNFGHFLMIDAW
jgi:hypothetical protein